MFLGVQMGINDRNVCLYNDLRLRLKRKLYTPLGDQRGQFSAENGESHREITA